MKNLIFIIALFSLNSFGTVIYTAKPKLKETYSHTQCDESPKETYKKIEELRAQTICSDFNNLKECEEYFRTYDVIAVATPNLQNVKCNEAQYSKSIPKAFISQQAIRTIENALSATDELVPRQYVRGLPDFVHHTDLHIKRVKKLGLALFDMHPELFPDVDRKLLSEILTYHDAEKLNPRFKSINGKPFYEELYERYGKKANFDVIEDMNAKGKAFVKELLSEKGLNPKDTTGKNKAKLLRIRRQLKRIEDIADLVDRGSSPVTPEEFGRKMDKASSFMKNSKDAALARKLEKAYPKIVEGLEYKQISQRAYNFLARRIKLREMRALGTHYKQRIANLARKASQTRLFSMANQSGSKAAGILLSKAFGSALLGVELATFSTKTGCALPGRVDFDSNCEPINSLTPTLIDYIFDGKESQAEHFSDFNTCNAVNETHSQVSKTIDQVTCHGSDTMTFKIGQKAKIAVTYDSAGNPSAIQFENSEHIVPSKYSGNIVDASFDENGEVQNICFEEEGKISCANIKEKSGQYAHTVVKTVSTLRDTMGTLGYPIAKARNCCQGNINALNEGSCENVTITEDTNSIPLAHSLRWSDKSDKAPSASEALKSFHFSSF